MEIHNQSYRELSPVPEPYYPEKIPVLMVHGILSSPLMWRDLTNRIMGDPLLQKKYQVWHYTYATGLPILTSADILRKQLDGVNIATTSSPAASQGDRLNRPQLRRIASQNHGLRQ